MKKIFILIFIAILFSLGCSRNEKETALNSGMMRSRASADMVMGSPTPVRTQMASQTGMEDSVSVETSELAAGGTGTDREFERKLVKRATVRIRVDNLLSADEAVNDLLSEYNGYAAYSNAEENSRHFSIRIPAHFYDAFLSGITGIGREINRFESTEDVTLRYYDLEGRLATRRELLRTYQSYLGRARNIEEILAVESKINELQYEIEFTGTQLRNLANQIDYATIELNILGPVSAASRPQTETFEERIKQLFSGFGGFLTGVAVVLLGFVIYGIPILAIVLLLFWLLFGKVGLARKLWSIIRK